LRASQGAVVSSSVFRALFLSVLVAAGVVRQRAFAGPALAPLDGGPPGDACLLGALPDRRTTPSSACMACHDGSVKGAADARTGHRYDLDYQRARRESTFIELRPDPEGYSAGMVVLQGGLVTCLSCHSPASAAPAHLAGPVDGPLAQRLCVACHVRD
jgi:hypothetical protein